MRPLHASLAILVATIWGANFVAAKVGVGYFPPFFLTALRFMLVGILLLPWVKFPSRREFFGITQIAFILGTLHFALMFAALSMGLEIASAAVIGQLGVAFSCLLGAIFLGDKLGLWRIMGLVVAFGGVAIVAGTPNVLVNMPAFLVAMAAAFCWGSSNIIMKRMGDIDILQTLAYMALLAVPMLLGISWVLEGAPFHLVVNMPAEVALAIGYTALCSTIAAYGIWYSLLKRYPVSQVAPYSLLVPVFGILTGQIVFHEPLTWQVIIGGGLTILGVAIIVIRRPKTIVMSEPV